MKSVHFRAQLFCLLVLGLGCGPDTGDLDFVREERCVPLCDGGTDGEVDAQIDAELDGAVDAGPIIPDEPLEEWDTEGAGPLSGIFAMQLSVNVKVVVDLEAKQLYRMRILQRGRQIRLKAEPCTVTLPNIPNVAELIVPDALGDVVKTKVTEDEGEFLSAEDPIGAVFTPPRVLVLLGADLDDPFTDPLPSMDMLERALDEDSDGNPGVTIDANTLLCRGSESAYVAVRLLADVRGTIEELDRFGGVVEASIEPAFLAFSDECLEPAASLIIEPIPGSNFDARRVGDVQDLDRNGNVSCPEIAWLEDSLFAPPE